MFLVSCLNISLINRCPFSQFSQYKSFADIPLIHTHTEPCRVMFSPKISALLWIFLWKIIKNVVAFLNSLEPNAIERTNQDVKAVLANHA